MEKNEKENVKTCSAYRQRVLILPFVMSYEIAFKAGD
jgi:hypothetical protein